LTALDPVQTPDIPGYRDVTLISTGSTSLVFRAVQSRLSRTVAIKVLLVDGDGTTHAQYQRELETTVLLSSQPHIVGIIDTGTTGAGQPYIVMEYCPGGSYAQILKQRGPLPVDEVVDVGAKIAEALQAAHDVGVLHRDVKPSNILRSAFGPALADFGIARAAHQLFGTDSLDRMTPYHASPEAMRKQNQSPASDVYSLASTMWHLLAGRPPFADPARPPRDLDDLRERVLHEPAPPVPRPDVPQWLQRELMRALAKDPGQRHPSAHTFGEILRYQAYRVRDEQPGPVAPATVTPPPAPAAPAPAAPVPPPGPMPLPPAPVAQPDIAPREAFRWPAAAPTRRTGRTSDPAPEPLAPEALEAAASSTITYDGSAEAAPYVVAPPPAPPTVSAPPVSSPRVSAPPVPAPPVEERSAPAPALTGPTEVYPLVEVRQQAPVQARPVPVPAPWIELDTPSLSTREVMQAADRPRRTGTLVAVLATSVAVLLVAAVVVVALIGRPQRHAGANPAPSTTQTLKVTGDGAPTDVRLQDDQTSITVSWTDPSGGTVQFAVLGGRANEQLQLLKVLDPGTTSWKHEGVNDAYDHCYLVAAFYKADGSDVAARSKQVCTHRHG
jgi:serine/threonine-protein kinase PknK